MNATKVTQQFGTLGSWYHFLELCLDEDERVRIVLHSGSRGIGNQLGGAPHRGRQGSYAPLLH